MTYFILTLSFLLIAFFIYRITQENPFKKKSEEEQEALTYRYSTIFHSINSGIGVRDINGNLIDYNSKYLEAYGVADIDSFLKYNTKVNSDIIPSQIINAYAKKEAGVHVIHYNYDLVQYKTNRTGTAVFEVKVAPMTNNKGQVMGTVALISDITKEYQNNKAIEEGRENLNLALNAGGVAAWIYDVKKRMFYTLHGNALAGEGISREQNQAILHPEDVNTQNEILESIAKGEQSRAEALFRYKGDNGEYRCYQSQMIAKKDDSGKVSHIMGTQKDLTDDIQRNEKLSNIIKENELILSNINSALVYIDNDYKVIWENVSTFSRIAPNAENSPYQAGKICYKSLKGQDSPCPDCPMSNAFVAGKTISKQKILQNGCAIEIFATPIPGNNGNYDGVVLRIDEITERNKLYSELEQSRNKAEGANRLMTNIFDQLPCVLFIKDIMDDYRYILANNFMSKATGIPSTEIVGKTDFDLFSPEVAEEFRRTDEEVVAYSGIYSFEEKVIWHGKQYVWQTSKYTMEAVNGHKLLVGLSLDITEKSNAYDELAIAKERAEESDKLKSAFLANMSHEIRTPLNAIVGFSDLLQSTEAPKEREEYMQVINVNNELLLRIIGDILDLSKIESGINEFNRDCFDMTPFFNELANSFRPKVHQPEVEFIEVNPYSKCIVCLDKNRLAQVLTNFVTNAIKFTHKGYIKMGYEYVNNGIKLYVEDTGIGIPKDKQEIIFRRFEKLDSFSQGTGLGLSICDAIIKAAGGNIGFESEKGIGTTFWAWIGCQAEIEYEKTKRL